jgi:hypothetical protein
MTSGNRSYVGACLKINQPQIIGHLVSYSLSIDWIGSIGAARRAGTSVASTPEAARIQVAKLSANKSIIPMPYRRFRVKKLAPSASAAPGITPSTMMARIWPRKSVRLCVLVAPIAMQTPLLLTRLNSRSRY